MSLASLSEHRSRYQIGYFPDRCPCRQFQLLNHGKQFFNVAQLVRAVDRQSKDSCLNPGTVENGSFFTERFYII